MSNRQYSAPDASVATLAKRAFFLSEIRAFFARQGVMEVETPLLCSAAGTDPHLQPFSTTFIGPDAAQGRTLYLQTSPEYAMKRLLVAGSGPIYQICKAFRNEEAGRVHNPEFTMLEWYRPGFDHFQLMDELDELVQTLLAVSSAERMTYQQAFVSYLSVDPLVATQSDLANVASKLGFDDWVHDEDADTLMHLLFSHHVEPNIGQTRPCFIYDFPASQAALARISANDPRVCERFELYFKGLELANGFHELSNADEQLRRFEQDNHKRRQAGKPELPIDEYFIAALRRGLSDCSGVAVGVDRLFMLQENAQQIRDVLAFSYYSC
ncbi:elongation factor P--(R)-beta-lysine ligase [Aestuariibacter salexigens]|uniref:elongation factor P--(R)-beta-lysine ligase n=1 Tax=Aestuariibacter salexigens TaxID=226010 RepID=UPI0004051065|nr:elongation factor P--(R)-beta-lysine ligase [Aestuariibacter salexigens]